MDSKLIMKMEDGIFGARTLKIYNNKVEIIGNMKHTSLLGSAGDMLSAHKTFYYNDITSVNYKEPSILKGGYISFKLKGSNYSFSNSEYEADSTFTFSRKVENEAKKAYDIAYKYVDDWKHASIKNSTENTTDEIKKYKELLDIGAITPEEFEIKKKELLGL